MKYGLVKTVLAVGFIGAALLFSGCGEQSEVKAKPEVNATTFKVTKQDDVLACPSEDSLYRMSAEIEKVSKSKEEGYIKSARLSGANQVAHCDSLTKGMKLELIETQEKPNLPKSSLVRLPNGWTTWIKSTDLN